jgi:YhcH/YjgK/YiaL family protein
MIIDRLENARRYEGLHPGFPRAFDFLRQPEMSALADGRLEILGERLYVLMSHAAGRGQGNARLEAHRKYLDIQYVVHGIDVIGWKPLRACCAIETPYDAARDIVFFRDSCDTWLSLPAGTFAVFFPDDAHAPLAGEGPAHKAVVKIVVDW